MLQADLWPLVQKNVEPMCFHQRLLLFPVCCSPCELIQSIKFTCVFLLLLFPFPCLRLRRNTVMLCGIRKGSLGETTLRGVNLGSLPNRRRCSPAPPLPRLCTASLQMSPRGPCKNAIQFLVYHLTFFNLCIHGLEHLISLLISVKT